MEKTRSESTPGRARLCASLGGVLLLVAVCAGASEPGVQLALERELAPAPGATSGVAFGVAGLRRQVGAAREALEEARAANAEQARTVVLAERRVSDLARLNAAQARALDVLELLARSRRIPPAAPAVASAEASASAGPASAPAKVVWLAGASVPDLAPSWGAVVSGLGALAVVGFAGFGAVRGRRLAGTPPQGSAKAPRDAPRPEPAPAVARAPEHRPVELAHRPRPAAVALHAAGLGDGAPERDAPDAVPASSLDTSSERARAEDGRPEHARLEDRWAALRELDTLIAFEDYEGASRALAPLVAAEPDNAEYRLRLAHIEAQRGNATVADRELDALSAMMDGPLSDTMARVRRIGRELMPGNPAFDTRLPDAPQRLRGAAGPASEESADALLEDTRDVPRALG